MKIAGLRIFTPLLMFFSLYLSAQKTPQDLGVFIFNSFKSNSLVQLDRVIPKPGEMLAIFKQEGTGISVPDTTGFSKKYIYHMTRFKQKCQDIVDDTVYFNVSWKQAVLDSTVSTQQVWPVNTEEGQPAKTYTRRGINIYFHDGSGPFLLRFRTIFFYQGLWKVDEDVGMRKLKAEAIKEK